jgi:hypothetical protein
MLEKFLGKNLGKPRNFGQKLEKQKIRNAKKLRFFYKFENLVRRLNKSKNLERKKEKDQ